MPGQHVGSVIGAGWLVVAGMAGGLLLGERFLLLTHAGRRSGRCYRTPLEVVGTGPAPGEVVVLGWLVGWRYDGGPDARRRLVRELPMVGFRPGARANLG